MSFKSGSYVRGVISMIKFNVIKGHVLILNHALSITSVAPLVSIFFFFPFLRIEIFFPCINVSTD